MDDESEGDMKKSVKPVQPKPKQVQPKIKKSKQPKRELYTDKLAMRARHTVRLLGLMRLWGVGAEEAALSVSENLDMVLRSLRSLPADWRPPRKKRAAPTIGASAWIRRRVCTEYADVLDANEAVHVVKLGAKLALVEQKSTGFRGMIAKAHLTTFAPEAAPLAAQ